MLTPAGGEQSATQVREPNQADPPEWPPTSRHTPPREYDRQRVASCHIGPYPRRRCTKCHCQYGAYRHVSIATRSAENVTHLTHSLVSFAEIIPQSVCTRHGLYIGAKMVGVVRVLLWTLVRLSVCVGLLLRLNVEVQGIIAWPIAKVLELTLGSHHGIIYRRAGMIHPLLTLLC